MKKTETKKVVIVTGSKGGCGKSTIYYLLAEKYKEAVLLDMDDATRTAMNLLAYRNPSLISLLNSSKGIDRGLLNEFFERIESHEKNLFFCDFGSSISEQFPQYLRDITPEVFSNLLVQINVEIEIICVIGGADIFKSTMNYLKELTEVVNGQLKVIVANNLYYPLVPEQEKQLNDFVSANNLQLISFTISADKNDSTQFRIKEVLKSGKGIQSAGVFTRFFFTNAIEKLEI